MKTHHQSNRVQNRNDDFLNTGANRNAQKQRRLRNLILVRRHGGLDCPPWIQAVGETGSTSAQRESFGRLLGVLRRRLLDQFLEARIVPERIEHGIEPEERRSERHPHCALVRYREQFS